MTDKVVDHPSGDHDARADVVVAERRVPRLETSSCTRRALISGFDLEDYADASKRPRWVVFALSRVYPTQSGYVATAMTWDNKIKGRGISCGRLTLHKSTTSWCTKCEGVKKWRAKKQKKLVGNTERKMTVTGDERDLCEIGLQTMNARGR